ncbi:MAG: LysR family transcriptional regulator [Clostridia bacterium]|nr:LysR family transcriptional regulator [Clostridia bacterium]
MYIKEHNIRYDQRYETLMVVRSLSNYTAAGCVLCLTPSAVSRQIHSIEQELGCALFTYDGKKLIATKECDLVGEYVARIRLIERRMGGDLSYPASDCQHLVIGATPSTQESILSDVVDLYQTNHPETQVTLHSGNRRVLEAMLCDRAIDFAVAEEDFSSDEISFIVLDTDHLVVAIANDSPYATANGITLQQLKNENLIMRAGNSGTRILFDAGIRTEGLTPNDFRIMMELDNISTIKKLVAEHYGVSILSQKACIKDVRQGSFKTVPLLGLSMVRTIRMFYRKNDRNEAVLHEILRIYQSIGHSLSSDQDH